MGGAVTGWAGLLQDGRGCYRMVGLLLDGLSCYGMGGAVTGWAGLLWDGQVCFDVKYCIFPAHLQFSM